MAVTWTISTLERNTDDGVVVAHWRASDADAVEASIASQIADSKAPAITTGVPW